MCRCLFPRTACRAIGAADMGEQSRLRIELTPTPLTAAAFAPFGEVVATEGHAPQWINGGNTERFDTLATLRTDSPDDRLVINLFRGQPRALPLRIELLERHPLGSQSFHPLSGQPYLILVAEAVTQPHPQHMHLFHARADQGICYAPNTWHHPLLALHRVSDFLVVDRQGAGNNCEEYHFPAHQEIWITEDAR